MSPLSPQRALVYIMLVCSWAASLTACATPTAPPTPTPPQSSSTPRVPSATHGEFAAFVANHPDLEPRARVVVHRIDLDQRAPLELVLEERCEPNSCDFEPPGHLSLPGKAARRTRFRIYDVTGYPERAPRVLHRAPILATHRAILRAYDDGAGSDVERDVFVRGRNVAHYNHEVDYWRTFAVKTTATAAYRLDLRTGTLRERERAHCPPADRFSHANATQEIALDLDGDGVSEFLDMSTSIPYPQPYPPIDYLLPSDVCATLDPGDAAPQRVRVDQLVLGGARDDTLRPEFVRAFESYRASPSPDPLILAAYLNLIQDSYTEFATQLTLTPEELSAIMGATQLLGESPNDIHSRWLMMRVLAVPGPQDVLAWSLDQLRTSPSPTQVILATQLAMRLSDPADDAWLRPVLARTIDALAMQPVEPRRLTPMKRRSHIIWDVQQGMRAPLTPFGRAITVWRTLLGLERARWHDGIFVLPKDYPEDTSRIEWGASGAAASLYDRVKADPPRLSALLEYTDTAFWLYPHALTDADTLDDEITLKLLQSRAMGSYIRYCNNDIACMKPLRRAISQQIAHPRSLAHLDALLQNPSLKDDLPRVYSHDEVSRAYIRLAVEAAAPNSHESSRAVDLFGWYMMQFRQEEREHLIAEFMRLGEASRLACVIPRAYTSSQRTSDATAQARALLTQMLTFTGDARAHFLAALTRHIDLAKLDPDTLDLITHHYAEMFAQPQLGYRALDDLLSRATRLGPPTPALGWHVKRLATSHPDEAVRQHANMILLEWEERPHE